MIDLVKKIESLRAGRPGPVDSRVVQLWMEHEDLDVQGAVFILLRDCASTHPARPPLSVASVDEFFRKYLARVIRQGSESLTAHGAGYEIVRWMIDMESKGEGDRLVGTVEWLGEIFTRGTTAERGVIVNGALEHLFERKSLRKLFKHWLNNDILAGAYREAAQWRKRGGTSGIT